MCKITHALSHRRFKTLNQLKHKGIKTFCKLKEEEKVVVIPNQYSEDCPNIF